MANTPIIVECTFNTDKKTLWQALTDNEFIKQWFLDLSEFKTEIGFKFQFVAGPVDGVQYLHLCEVTEVEPEKKLTYSWRFDGYQGISYLTFELFADDEKTKLILTHSGIESFPQSNPDFAPIKFAEGWNAIINDSLYKLLSNNIKPEE